MRWAGSSSAFLLGKFTVLMMQSEFFADLSIGNTLAEVVSGYVNDYRHLFDQVGLVGSFVDPEKQWRRGGGNPSDIDVLMVYRGTAFYINMRPIISGLRTRLSGVGFGAQLPRVELVLTNN